MKLVMLIVVSFLGTLVAGDAGMVLALSASGLLRVLFA